MDMQVETEVLAASFDIVARQDETEKAVTVLRSDVDEVKARLDRVSRAAARPSLSGIADPAPEVKGFVDGYLRKGREAEVKSITGTVPGDGGYAVPQEIDALIAAQLKDLSPIRQIAQIVQVGTAGYRKLVTTGGTASGWVSETAGRPETATPKFEEVAPPSGELYTNPAASQAMLDDAACEGETAEPPAAPVEGEAWLISSGATGEWTGEDGKLASRQSGNWLLTAPADGMRLFDRSTGQTILYRAGWQRPTAPAPASGGSVIDAEARAAIGELIAALVDAGIFPTS